MNADRGKQLKAWQRLVLVILFVLLLPILLLWFLCRFIAQTFILLAIWVLWLPRGKDTLIVFSRSPHWQEYFESGLIPQLEHRAMILNWSDRIKWPMLDLRTLAFRAFAGERLFNPVVILFKLFRWPERFRFYEPFKDRKHGKDQPLKELEEKLARRLEAPISVNISHT